MRWTHYTNAGEQLTHMCGFRAYASFTLLSPHSKSPAHCLALNIHTRGPVQKKKKKNRHENSKQVYKRHIEWLQSLYGTSDVLF